MRTTPPPALTSAVVSVGLTCRNVTVAFLSGWLTRRSYAEVERRLAARPLRDQAAIVAATLGALLLLAMLAAQGGPIGLCLYGLAVVIVAR